MQQRSFRSNPGGAGGPSLIGAMPRSPPVKTATGADDSTIVPVMSPGIPEDSMFSTSNGPSTCWICSPLFFAGMPPPPTAAEPSVTVTTVFGWVPTIVTNE